MTNKAVTKTRRQLAAAPSVVVKKTGSANLPATRHTQASREQFSLLEFVASSRVNLPRELKEQRPFLRFLQRACADKVLVEQVQRFRDAVVLSAIGNASDEARQAGDGLTIAVAGANGGEGVSFVSLMLALSLGSCTNRRVALLDGRFNGPRFNAMSDVLGLSKNSISLNKGASQILGYYNESQPNLYFLNSAGDEPEVEFFSDKQLKFFLADLRQQFDFTIIDSPPLLSGTSGVFLAPNVDRLYLVSSVHKTTNSDIDRCIDLTKQAGSEISGVVLNRQRVPFWGKAVWKDFFY